MNAEKMRIVPLLEAGQQTRYDSSDKHYHERTSHIAKDIFCRRRCLCVPSNCHKMCSLTIEPLNVADRALSNSSTSTKFSSYQKVFYTTLKIIVRTRKSITWLHKTSILRFHMSFCEKNGHLYLSVHRHCHGNELRD